MPLAIQIAEYIHHAYFHGTFDSAVLSQHGRGCPRSIRKVAMHGTHMHCCPIICFVRCCLQQLVDQRILQERANIWAPTMRASANRQNRCTRGWASAKKYGLARHLWWAAPRCCFSFSFQFNFVQVVFDWEVPRFDTWVAFRRGL